MVAAPQDQPELDFEREEEMLLRGIELSSSAWKACDKACEINGSLDF
jgi:hypothetical protein